MCLLEYFNTSNEYLCLKIVRATDTNRFVHLFISYALSPSFTYDQYSLELFPTLHHEYLYGKLPQDFIPQTGSHQNPWHSHLQCPTPNANWSKTTALYVHSNLWGSTHRHLGLLMMNTKYATLSNFPYIRPVHPGILRIPNSVTCVALHEHKQVYKKNLWVFQKVHGVKQDLI